MTRQIHSVDGGQLTPSSARVLIDRQLTDVGWSVRTSDLNLFPAHGVAAGYT